jgi:putative ABC transport system permease protein
MLRRDARGGELRLLAAALAVAVAALTAVGFFADRVRQALERESHQLLGADLLLTADQPWPATFADEARARGLQVVETRTFPSMVTHGAADDCVCNWPRSRRSAPLIRCAARCASRRR